MTDTIINAAFIGFFLFGTICTVLFLACMVCDEFKKEGLGK